MKNDEILHLFATGNYSDIPYLIYKQEKQENIKLFEIVIENNYIDLAIILIQNIIYFIDDVQILLELSIKNIKNFEIFNMLWNRCVLCNDIVDINPSKLLFCAVEQNNMPVFFILIKELFLDEDHNIDEFLNADNDTLLMIAAKKQHTDLVNFMIQFCNADLNKAINKGYCSVKLLISFYENATNINHAKVSSKPSLIY